METKIKELVEKLKKEIKQDNIIVIVYNPSNQEGITMQDCSFLKTILEQTKYTYPTFILSGHGGNFAAGVLFPHLIQEAVKKYKVFIPSICGSALCYTIFKANELIIGKNTKITQIDPMFEYQGENLRAIKHIRSVDTYLNRLSRQVLDIAQKHLTKLCIPPSVFKFEVMDPSEFQHLDLIATRFMNKSGHEQIITIKELEELEVNLKKINTPQGDTIAN